jgi:hypothetical protein
VAYYIYMMVADPDYIYAQPWLVTSTGMQIWHHRDHQEAMRLDEDATTVTGWPKIIETQLIHGAVADIDSDGLVEVTGRDDGKVTSGVSPQSITPRIGSPVPYDNHHTGCYHRRSRYATSVPTI